MVSKVFCETHPGLLLFIFCFICNSGDTIQYHGGLRSRELGQAPMVQVFLTPRHILHVLLFTDKLDNEKTVRAYKFVKNLTPLNRPNLRRKRCS